MTTNKNKKIKLSTERDITNLSTRFSSFRGSIHRTRTSIVPQYTIDTNQIEISNVQINDDDQTDALLAYVLKPLWDICRVSPLYNLKYSPSHLKKYGTKLKQVLNGNITSDIEYEVEIHIVENLKMETKDPDALEIIISNQDKSKVMYNGILFSWGSNAVCKSNITHLPLLFDHGHGKIVYLIRNMLMKIFDCVITPFSFSQSEIMFLTAFISSFAPVDGTAFVNFVYNVPFMRNSTSFEICMSADDIYYMWESCFPKGEEINVHDEQSSQKWYSTFQKYITHVYEIDLSKLELTSIKFPNVNFQKKGKLQLKEVEISKYILRLLCEMSVILKGSTPRLGLDYD